MRRFGWVGWVVVSLMAAAAVVLCGCGSTKAGGAGPGRPARPAPRVTRPAAAPTQHSELVSGNTDFALRLYQRLSREEGNLFFAPYSISTALAMTYAGARGETEGQMARTLGFSLPQAELHPAFNALSQELGRGEETEGFRLHLANALWGQTGYSFRQEFLDLLARSYGAGMELVDYTRDPEGARRAINEWAEKKTEGKIKDLVPRGEINEATRLVLANAVYFDAKWLHPFRKASTGRAPFALPSGRKVEVDTMHATLPAGYAEDRGWQVVELPYQHESMGMDVLLPPEGALAASERSLDAARLSSLLGGLEPREVTLALPKFSYESRFKLNDTLAAMGMPDAFGSGRTDFSGMDGTRRLFIQFVVHKALVRVDEEGTEAAAATAVGMGGRAAPGEVVRVTVDRPFLFLIRDTRSGTILFLGRVVDPRGSQAK